MPPNPLALLKSARLATKAKEEVKVYPKLVEMRKLDRANQLEHWPSQTPLEPTREQLLRMLDEPPPSGKRQLYDADQDYAQGGSVKNPDQMTHKKFVPGANPLVQIPRGFVAGTASLAREGEDLARMFARYVSAPGSIAENWGNRESVLPTNKFFRDELPFKDEGVGAEELQTLGGLAGGAGLPSLAKLTAKYAPKIVLAAAEAGPVGRSAQRGIIKAPGGNWLNGSIEDAVNGLKRTDQQVAYRNLTERMGAPDQVPPQVTSEQSINDWVDKKLAKYVEKQMASSEDPVRLMADAWPEKKAKLLDLAQAKIDMYAQKIVNTARERGQPEYTLTEMRQEMIKLEKEKALIEAQGGLHVAPESLNFRPEMYGKYPALGQTFVGQSPEARVWEGASDMLVGGDTAGNFNKPAQYPMILNKNPWLQKVDPATQVYAPTANHLPQDLGFDHLIDELRNATNAESGLPAELLWDSKDLVKKTVPDAVEHVSKINAWRATQKAEADLTKANNAATHLHKDYPEAGMKWVELKHDGTKKLPAELEVVETSPGTFKTQLRHPDPYGSLRISPPYDSAEEALAAASKPDTTKLADALKYEGDTMKHCVGGYCDEVASGSTRIFSLRDAKGRPHATVEAAPSGSNSIRSLKEGTPEDFKILQIKGPRNGKPDDEYLPYVQDFVRSGKWSDVEDLHHTGFIDLDDTKTIQKLAPGATPADAYEIVKIMAEKGQAYYVPDDVLEAAKIYGIEAPKGFARGGSVYNPARVDEIISQHHNSEYGPARVDALVAQLKEEMYA